MRERLPLPSPPTSSQLLSLALWWPRVSLRVGREVAARGLVLVAGVIAPADGAPLSAPGPLPRDRGNEDANSWDAEPDDWPEDSAFAGLPAEELASLPAEVAEEAENLVAAEELLDVEAAASAAVPPETVPPETVPPEAVEPVTIDLADEIIDISEPAAPAGQVASGGLIEHDQLPLPDYDHLTLGSLRVRLRSLDPAALAQVRDYERAHANRLAVVTMLENRLAKVTAG